MLVHKVVPDSAGSRLSIASRPTRSEDPCASTVRVLAKRRYVCLRSPAPLAKCAPPARQREKSSVSGPSRDGTVGAHGTSGARDVTRGNRIDELRVYIHSRSQVRLLIHGGRYICVTGEPYRLRHRAEVDAARQLIRSDLGDSRVQLPVCRHERLASRRFSSHLADDRLKCIDVLNGSVTRSICVDEFF